MKYLFVIIIMASLLFACSQSSNKGGASGGTSGTAAVAVKDSGWISLFDGHSLHGWHTYGEPEATPAWGIDSNAIHLDASKKDGEETIGGGDLITDDEYSNFDLTLEWKISKGGNSGIKFYVHEDTAKYDESGTGLEMQVLDNRGHSDAAIAKRRAGSLYDLIAPSHETVKKAGEWNYAEIKCYNGQLEFYLNGPKIVATTLWDDNWKKLIAGSKYKDMPGWGTFKKGHILLQDHGFDVWYRDIRIRKL